MLFQGKTREGQPNDFAGFAVFGEEIQGHHGSVIQFRLPVAQGAGRDAHLFCRSVNRSNQLFVIDNGKLDLGRAELGHAPFGGRSRGDMEVIGVQNGMRTGDDDRVRLQVRYEFRSPFKRVDGGLDTFFFPVAHFGKDEGRMGDLYCAENCHGKNSFLPYRYSIDGTGCLSGQVPIIIVRTHSCNKGTLSYGVTIYPDYYYTAKYEVRHL